MLNLGHWSTDGLVFLWRGIEAGNVVDESFGRSHGTITGATWVGNGLNFNDSGDAVNCGDILDLDLDDLTIEVWFSGCTAANDFQSLVAKAKWGGLAGRYYIVFDGDGNITANYDRAGEAVATTIAETAYIDGGLHQMVAVYDRSADLTLYMDGASASDSVDISAGVATDHNTNAVLLFGSYNDIDETTVRANTNFHGDIHSVRIWKGIISVGEIQQLHINPGLPMEQEPIWLMYSPAVVGGSLQWILDGGIGPSPLKGSVVR